MNPNFQPDDQVPPDAKLVDPEAYDASEQQFAASLETEPESSIAEGIAFQSADSSTSTEALSAVSADAGDKSSAWRKEITDRVNKYRSKSPREPRYPSLQLKFETWAPMRTPDPPPVSLQSVALEPALESEPHYVPEVMPEPEPIHAPIHAPVRPNFEVANNVIEFPRYTAEPPNHHDKLAEPVVDQLRILEAPEIAPAPPALGGIHIEQVEERPQERRPGFEIPLQSASIVRRIAAAIIDAVVVGGSLAAFGYIFLRLSAPVLPLAQWIAVGAVLACIFWIAYQYSFLVHTGSTPGLRLARLRLAHFNGTTPSRTFRRWRVVTSILSAISLGLGYVWCFLDEDQLCWHDRITKTHLAPKHPVHTNDED